MYILFSFRRNGHHMYNITRTKPHVCVGCHENICSNTPFVPKMCTNQYNMSTFGSSCIYLPIGSSTYLKIDIHNKVYSFKPLVCVMHVLLWSIFVHNLAAFLSMLCIYNDICPPPCWHRFAFLRNMPI